jgi:biotin carboxylase
VAGESVADERRRTVLVIGGGGIEGHVADWSAKVVHAARRRAVRLEIADRPEQFALVRGVPGVDTVDLDFRDTQAASKLASARAADGALTAVTSFRELGVEAAAHAAAAAGTAWNSPAAVATVRRKDRSRRALAAAGFPQPECRAFDAQDEAIRFLRSASGRWVVKPASSLGSQGVHLVQDGDNPQPAIETAAGFGTPILVEAFVDGEELSAEGVFVDGTPHVVAFTRKRLGPPPYFVSLGHVMPPGLDARTSRRATAAVVAALRSVGLTHSVFHVELWLTPTGDVVIGELHARPGGDWIHRLVEEAYGVDLLDVALAGVAGDPVRPPLPRACGAAATAAVVADRPGTLVGFDGIDDIQWDPRCVRLDVKAQSGRQYGPPTSHYDRLALVVARGPDPASATEAACSLAQRLRPVLA